jgi:hypothetical protein
VNDRLDCFRTTLLSSDQILVLVSILQKKDNENATRIAKLSIQELALAAITLGIENLALLCVPVFTNVILNHHLG